MKRRCDHLIDLIVRALLQISPSASACIVDKDIRRTCLSRHARSEEFDFVGARKIRNVRLRAPP
jgi:hypothetical protein